MRRSWKKCFFGPSRGQTKAINKEIYSFYFFFFFTDEYACIYNGINKRSERARGLESVQSVRSSQSKHVSAVRNSLHNEVSQPCNTVPAFWGTAGGSGPFPDSAGARQPHHWLRPWPETSSHFMCFALIPHPSKQAAVRVPDMLCLSGHLDIHLVSRGSVSVNITARWTCINNSVLRVTIRSRQRRLPRPLSEARR